MSGEAGWFSPSLINSVNGIVAINHAVQGIYLYISQLLVTVGIDYYMYRLVGIGSYAQERGMAVGSQFGKQMLVVKPHGIVMRVRPFPVVAEACGPFFRQQPQLTAYGSHGKRAVVLRASAHYPVAVAEALQQRVLIIIWCDALLLSVLRLWSPEVLSVGHEHRRQRLPMFLAAFTE